MSLQWWFYVHENGSVQVKLFHDDAATAASIQDAHMSPFVAEVVEAPFPAPDRIAALAYARKRLEARAGLVSV